MSLEKVLMGQYTFNLYLAVPVLAGVLVVLPILLHTRARGLATFRRLWAVFLVVAAAPYVVFAAVWGSGRSVAVELVGLVLFGLVAAIGARWWSLALPLGWVAHVAWDLLLHPVQTDALVFRFDASPYAPWWYPGLCVGFDLAAAGFLAAALRAQRPEGTA